MMSELYPLVLFLYLWAFIFLSSTSMHVVSHPHALSSLCPADPALAHATFRTWWTLCLPPAESVPSPVCITLYSLPPRGELSTHEGSTLQLGHIVDAWHLFTASDFHPPLLHTQLGYIFFKMPNHFLWRFSHASPRVPFCRWELLIQAKGISYYLPLLSALDQVPVLLFNFMSSF